MIIALAAFLAAAEPQASADALGWLAGTWVGESGGGWTEEHWSAPRGGTMIGYSRSGEAGGLRGFEFLRLAPGSGGALAYHAMPQGRAAVAFPLVASGPATATFENPAHDYPQRIVYRRDGDTLTATISAADGTKPRSWTYRRAGEPR